MTTAMEFKKPPFYPEDKLEPDFEPMITGDSYTPTFTPPDPSWIGNSSNVDKKQIDRHCGFCLIPISAQDVKSCSKCHRRAYCSRKCQSKDWAPKNAEDGGTNGAGQCHKSWCGLPYGEQDLDWEVAPIPGKGNGMVAKRCIPANCRILVDGWKNNDMIQKLNDVADSFAVAAKGLGRSSRLANHACDPNGSTMLDPDFKVLVLYSKQEIAPGEEITVTYIGYNETFHTIYNLFGDGKMIDSFAASRYYLATRFNIVCPPDCFCRNEAIGEAVKKGRYLDQTILEGSSDLKNQFDLKHEAFVDLQIIKKMFGIYEETHGAIIQKAVLLDKAFRVAVKQNVTLELGKKFLGEAYLIWSNILHPRVRMAKTDAEFMENVAKADKYLCLESCGEKGGDIAVDKE